MIIMLLDLLFVDKKEIFGSFMKRVEAVFAGETLPAVINKQVEEMQYFAPEYMYKDAEVKQGFAAACCELISKAINKATGKEYKGVSQKELSFISQYLSFDCVQTANERLMLNLYLKSNLAITLLQLAFYAVIYVDSESRRRYELAYTLWQNSIEFSYSGYSAKLNQFYPYYITHYQDSIFLTNPVEGEVMYFSRDKGPLRGAHIKNLTKEVFMDDNVICARTYEDELIPLVEYSNYYCKPLLSVVRNSTDLKLSEREKKKLLGFEIKDTPWLTVDIGSYPDESGKKRHFTLREHLFIPLMVYGLEPLKFAIMQGNSILTIDHRSGEHDQNKIDNLELLTRYQNIGKEVYDNSDDDFGEEPYFFNFFDFFSNQLKAIRKRQDDLDYRVSV